MDKFKIDNLALQKRKENAISTGQGNLLPIYISKAKGAELWDVEGRRYIDFAAGIAVVNTGHGHPKVLSAIKEQLDRFSHTCVMINPYMAAVELAEKLNEIVPIKKAKTVLTTTGSDAVENAIKIAKYKTQRPGIISFYGAFHGRTYMCMGLTGKVIPYKLNFGLGPNGIYHIPFPIAYHGVEVKDCLKALDNLFKHEVQADQIAAIIIEVVQGEGGFYIVPDAFLKELRAICDHHGILLIVDEIQSGFARTGKMFALDHYDVEPDLVTLAKGLGGGVPISAVVGKAEIMDSLKLGALGGTYVGSPLGCAAALAVIDVIEKEGLCEKANHLGKITCDYLKTLQEKIPKTIGHVRNLGAMIAIEFVKDGDANKPDADLTKAIVKKASENGLIILPCGVRGNAIRILFPLTISEEILKEGLQLLSKTILEVVN